MKTHILLALIALIVSACASKEHIGQNKFENQQERQDEFTRNQFEAGDRFQR